MLAWFTQRTISRAQCLLAPRRCGGAASELAGHRDVGHVLLDVLHAPLEEKSINITKPPLLFAEIRDRGLRIRLYARIRRSDQIYDAAMSHFVRFKVLTGSEWSYLTPGRDIQPSEVLGWSTRFIIRAVRASNGVIGGLSGW